MVFPAIIGPIGLGLYGAAVQYHLHYMILALGFFFVTFASTWAVPICLNYIVERFITSASQAAIIMNCYRLAFAIALGFFVFPWEKAVDVGWTFGMAVLFEVLAALLIFVLVWKGKVIRRWSFSGLLATEDGSIIGHRDL